MNYKQLGRQFQLEGQFCHDTYDNKTLTRQQGIDRFNQVAQEQGLAPLRDPKGYMALDHNTYQAVQETYARQYDQKAQDIADGFSMGTVHAMDGVLNKLRSVIRADSRQFLPHGMVLGDLRFIKQTPEMQDTLDRLVSHRVEMTLKKSISRSVSQASFRQSYEAFHQDCQQFSHLLAETLQPSQTLSSPTLDSGLTR